MRRIKITYLIPAALASFLSAGAAFAGLTVNADGSTTWDAKPSAPSCIHVSAPGSEPTIAADGTVIAEVKTSGHHCVGGIDYEKLTREQFDELAVSLSGG
jgi:hypothetical protein